MFGPSSACEDYIQTRRLHTPRGFQKLLQKLKEHLTPQGQILLDVPLGILGSRSSINGGFVHDHWPCLFTKRKFQVVAHANGADGAVGFLWHCWTEEFAFWKIWSRSPPDWMALRRARRTRRTRHDGFNLYRLVGLRPCVYIYFWSFRICFFFLIFCVLFFFGLFQCFSYFFFCRIMNMARFARIPEEQVQEGQWAMLNCWLSFLPLLKWSILWFRLAIAAKRHG